MVRIADSEYDAYNDAFLVGKTTFYVYNQSKIDSLPNDKIKELNGELITLEDENKLLSAEVKSYSGGKVQDPPH